MSNKKNPLPVVSEPGSVAFLSCEAAAVVQERDVQPQSIAPRSQVPEEAGQPPHGSTHQRQVRTLCCLLSVYENQQVFALRVYLEYLPPTLILHVIYMDGITLYALSESELH